MTRAHQILFLLSAATALTWPGVPASAQCANGVACPMVWSDEFDGTSLDLNNWSHQVGTGCPDLCGWGNNELQYYTTSAATVGGGTLTIRADEQNVGGRNYTSARIRSLGKGDWTYGRFEMRAKLPQGQGMWPAFWMLSSVPDVYGTWAASGELDIMEIVGNDPGRVLGTAHYGGNFPENVFSGTSIRRPAASLTDEFHVYAIEWQEGQVRWYLDDELYSVQNAWNSSGGAYPAPFDVQFHLLLNLAVGGNLPGDPDGSTVFPMDYVIDYVRVYELPAALPPTILFDAMEHGSPFDNNYFAFNGTAGGGSIGGATGTSPGDSGGQYVMTSAWGSGGNSGYVGGYGRTKKLDLSGMNEFVFWINPDAGQNYRLDVKLQEDDNGDGDISSPQDDEFRASCVVSPTGPCAISGGGWQEVRIPLSQFVDDNGFLTGGNGVLDATLASNGALVNLVFTIVSLSGADISFKTDNWYFASPADGDADGVSDSLDNCSAVANADQRDTNADGFGNLCDADFDDSCLVNLADLVIFKAAFFSSDPDTDLNGDGTVNLADLVLFKASFFSPPGPSGLAACQANRDSTRAAAH